LQLDYITIRRKRKVSLMFEKLRLKIYSLWVSRRKPKEVGFVNPYQHRAKIAVATTKLNPYITNYESKKPKSFKELLFAKNKQDVINLPKIRRLPQVEAVVVPQEPVGPTFFEDVIRVSSGDVVYFATTCRAILPRLHSFLPKRAEPRIVSGDEIRRTCENLRW
jgi:hypothetical protein